MRITSSSFYNNIYGENNKINRQLFDVNKQISSGLKIQYAHDDPNVFINTLRLDDEITTLTQVKNSAESAYKFSTQTDTTIGEITKTLESMKVKLINAANGTHSDTSMQAIAKEMRGLKNHLMTLANASVGGQYLFAGTAVSVKPVGTDGTYRGNDQDLEAFLGSGIKQKSNISGTQLFLGEESKVNRMISANIVQYSMTEMYPEIMKITNDDSQSIPLTASDTIRDLMGDTDTDAANDAARSSYFYLQGTRTDGTAFKSTIKMGMDETLDDLMHQIALAYDPNQASPQTDQVSVSLNASGQIEIVDKRTGSSKLDFHMVGAVDFDDLNAGDAADISDLGMYAATPGEIDNLQTGTTDFETAAVTTPGLFIKEFTRSGLDPADSGNTIEGINYDRTIFAADGAKLLSNISQIVKSDNSYATQATKLGAVASGATYDTVNDRFIGLDGTILKLSGSDINGVAYDMDIQLLDAGSQIVINSANGAVAGTTFDLEDALGNPTDAGKVTYKQIMDVVNMAVTNQLPTSTIAVPPLNQYNTAINNAQAKGSVTLDYAGRLGFEDKTTTTTQASLSLYDDASNTYPATDSTTDTGSILVFNANSALSVRDPKNDFFTQIEQIIRSVEEGKVRPDGSDTTDPRNIGIQNSIQMIDDLSDHVSRLQTEAGSYSQVLQASSDRTQMLIVSTKTLQSEVIDTDIAEATLRLQQLSLNYQALFSSISKVSQLSLVNYL